MKTIFLAILVALSSCGPNKQNDRQAAPAPDPRIVQLQTEVEALQGTQTQINNFVAGEYDTCAATGDGTAAFVQQVCKIAQSAAASLLTQLKGEMGTYDNWFKAQLQAVSDSVVALTTQESTDVATLNASITAINTQITTINSSITTLQSQMTSAQSAITALQTLTASISGTLNNTISTLEIGTENVAAGPLYETIERRTDKTKIVGYVEAFSAAVSLGSNPLTATNGSASIKVNLTAHGLSVGTQIQLAGLVGNRGFVANDVTGYVVVASVVDANNFTFVANHTATANGAFGGNAGTYQVVTGRGLAQVWISTSGADTVVRTTSYGTPYNWIVLANGNVCYDKTVAAQTFATISAQGANVACK